MTWLDKETVRCPCCDQHMEIEVHESHTHWSLRQVLMIQRMRRNGIPSKVIGRLFRVQYHAVAEIYRKAPRIIIPAVTATVERKDAA